MKHTDEELAQWQALPLSIKELMTKERIRYWVNEWGEDGVYISFSGGKDSTVLKHIVESMGYNIPAVFVNTGLEYPEIQKFAKSQTNVITLTPSMRFDEVIKKYGYPIISKPVAKRVQEYRNAEKKGRLEKSCAYKEFNGIARDKNNNLSRYNKSKYKFIINSNFKISNKCCDIMKKKPFRAYEEKTGRKYPFIATMAAESLDRRTTWKKYGCNAFNSKHPKSTPLAFWTEQDILHYIKKYNVPYCSIYGEIKLIDNQAELEGQVSIQDFLGDYRQEDLLTTTGCNRTGCIFCMFGCHLEKSPNRFQRLKETHPKQYNYCINGGEMVNGIWQPNKDGLGLGKVLDYIGVKY